MSRLALLVAVVLGGAVGGCAQPPRRSPTAQPPAACRTAVTPTGSPAAVDWVFADAGGDRPMLDDWCRSVGPALVLERSVVAAAPRLEELVVVSWNVEVGGGDIEALLDRLRDAAHPDRAIVLLLQEAYRAGSLVPPLERTARPPGRIAPTPPSGLRRSAIDVAERRGLSLVYVPSMRNGRGDAPAIPEDRGNTILSTLPLSELSAIELPFEHQRRVAVAATVPVLNSAGHPSTLRVVSAHLDARASWRRGVFLWFGRTRQARALVDAIGPSALPTILGGDFNSWLGDLEPDVRQTRGRFGQTPPSRAHVTFPVVGRLGLHLDHLFFRLPDGWDAEVAAIDERWGSDHYPIVGAIKPKEGLPLARR